LVFGVGYIQARKNSLRAANWKESYRVTIKGSRTAALMCLLYPLMGMRRREQIERAVASLSAPTNVGKLVLPSIEEQRRDSFWLAGLLEGEGSFIPGPPSKPNSPRVQLLMTDEDVVKDASLLLGVSYRRAKRYGPKAATRKQIYFAVIKGTRAAAIMKRIQPSLGKRRQRQIEKALANYDSKIRFMNGAQLTRGQVLEIYRRAHAREPQASIASDFGIHRTTVADIKRGKSWSWLTSGKAPPED
jgi:hypothetical protein